MPLHVLEDNTLNYVLNTRFGLGYMHEGGEDVSFQGYDSLSQGVGVLGFYVLHPLHQRCHGYSYLSY